MKVEQLKLNFESPNTDFINATSLQLSWCKGKELPDESDKREAAELVAKWNKRRKDIGLKPW